MESLSRQGDINPGADAMAQAKRASPSYEEPEENVAEQPRPVVLPPSKARAGIMDRDTLYMLIVGTLLTVLFLAAVFIYFRNA
jgi:hypothetical protein